jgi:alpha-tubulin suppressor-like RCC1 family protein
MIGSSTEWASVAPGQGGSCAIRTDDSLWCWGDNDSGEVGDGTRWGETPATVVFP